MFSISMTILSWIGYCAGSLVVLVLILFLSFSAYIVNIRWKHRHIPGPPTKSFFWGNGSVFSDVHKIDRQKEYIRLAKEYGPVVKIQIFHFVLMIVSSPEFAKELLTKSKYKKPDKELEQYRVTLGVPFFGNSISMMADHEEWKVRRHIINPIFHRSYLEKLVPVVNDVADKMVDLLATKAETGSSVSIQQVFSEAFLDATCRIAFSIDVRELKQRYGRRLLHDIRLCNEAATEFNYNRNIQRDPSKREIVQEYIAALKSVRHIATEILDERLEKLRNGLETPQDTLGITLDGLLNHCPKGDIVSELVVTIVGGSDTTSSAVSFVMMELGRRSEYMEAVRQEVQQVIGDKTFIAGDDLTQLHWMTATIKEAMRLYPPSVGAGRIIPEDCTLFGHKFYKGTFMFVCFAALHHLHHEDGGEFRPEKWLPENEPRTNYNYMPFSLGQRSCAGRVLAMIEAKILLSKFFQRFTFRLDPEEPFTLKERLTQQPTSGVLGTVSFAE